MPKSYNDWIALIGQSLGILLVISTIFNFVVVKPLREKMDGGFKGQGERLGKVEVDVAAGLSDRASLHRQIEHVDFKVANMTEQFGRMEASIETLRKTVHDYHEDRVGDESDIRERLARIETKIDVTTDLKTALVAFAKEIKTP
jgi:predicted  nucleic acid-binding Zn-ribbon protein